MKVRPRHLISSLLVIFIAFFGFPWAVHPFLNPPQGISDAGWTHAQLIRDRYPIHLVDPAWLSDDTFWEIPETGVRLGVVLFAIVSVFVFSKLRGNKMATAVTERTNSN
jgi:hypothetical protein